ncbi:MAG: S8 family serine peptidase [Candidatus Thermoplasmatota archaeon]|nr:S8 family serine peptidase [Candidatus Thermoplasmatota archaeon]
MKLPYRILSFLCVGILVTSIFVGISYSDPVDVEGSDEMKIVMIKDLEKEEMKGLQHSDVIDRYGRFTLVEVKEKRISGLKDNYKIDRLKDRNELNINGHVFESDEGLPDLDPALSLKGYEKGTEGLYIIDMVGPVNPEWQADLEARGVDVLNYQPNYVYEAKMTPKTAEEVEALDFVDWVSVYQPGFKLADDLEPGHVTIRLAGEPSSDVIDEIRSKVNIISMTGTGTLGTQVLAEVQDQNSFNSLARIPQVYYISNKADMELKDEMATQIIGGGLQEWDAQDTSHPSWDPYRGEGDHGSKVNQMGYTGDGVVVAVADTGLGDGTVGDAGHPDFQNRVLSGMRFDESGTVPDGNWGDNEGTPNDGQGHGTHTAGSIAGNTHDGSGNTEPGTWDWITDLGPYYTAQGSAPDAELHVQKVFINASVPQDVYLLPEEAKQSEDAYVHSNSWGATQNFGEYLITSEVYDAAVRDADRETGTNEQMVITVASGNSGPDPNTVAAPATAKNVISVGATENFNPELEDEHSDYFSCKNPDNIAEFSSRGWTNDNRIKPDVVAPGDGIDSTFWAAEQGQPSYSPMSGTSMANPAVAGASAVVVDWFEDTYLYTPSPAMVRGLMINTATELDDADGNTGPIPNKDEGWGMVNLTAMIDSDLDFILKDQMSILKTGEEDAHEVEVQDPSEPLDISLTWTDEEAAEGDTEILKNDLNLVVESPTGQTYTGNAFQNSWTPAGTDANGDFDQNSDGYDDVNNVENVFIKPSDVEEGNYTVKIQGKNIPSDGNNDGEPSQDYALVAHNGVPEGPSVKIDSPQDGEVVRESNFTVEWIAQNFEHNEVRLDGNNWTDVGTSTNYTFTGIEDGDHTVEVRTEGILGDTVTDIVNFKVQTVGIKIISPEEGGGFGGRTVTIGWNSSYAANHEIRRDTENWKNIGENTSHTFEDLETGEHWVNVKAVDVEQHEAEDSVTFFVDTDPPDISIDSPSEGSNFDHETVTVEWSGQDEMSGLTHYEVRKTGGSWEDVGESTSHTFTFEDGEHAVEIKAVDEVGNEEISTVSFTVDTTPPLVEVLEPSEETVDNSNVTVEWTGQDETTAVEKYEVRKEGGSWEDVGVNTSHTFTFEDGDHTVEIKAVDEVGNEETSTVSFTVDATPPELSISYPYDGEILSNSDITVEWTAEDETTGLDHYEIRQVGESWEDIGEDNFYSYDLEDGEYSIEVRAVDNAGNVETGNSSFIIDTTPPELEVVSPEEDKKIEEDSVTVEWSGEPTGTNIVDYEVRIDGDEWIDPGGEGQHTFEDLEDGDHTVEIRATDEAGNTNTTSTEFTIETSIVSDSGLLGGYWWLIPLILIVLVVIIVLAWKGRGDEEEEEYAAHPSDEGAGSSWETQARGSTAGAAGATGASSLSSEKESCPDCRGRLQWVEEYERWFCENCEEYKSAGGAASQSTRSETCPDCRAQLQWVEEYERWYCENCGEYK